MHETNKHKRIPKMSGTVSDISSLRSRMSKRKKKQDKALPTAMVMAVSIEIYRVILL
jgi:hypothetical protein